jgi:AcrR family transcriptional regulator
VTSSTHSVHRERLAAIEAELASHAHRRVPRELRRRHLLELATELFTERGFEAASMDELAERAGVSKPVIYDQFGSKDGLLAEVVDALGVELNHAVILAVQGKTEPGELLESGSLAFYRFVGQRRGTWSMIFGAFRGLGVSPHAAQEKLIEIRERQDTLVATVILAAAQAQGVQPNELEVSAITRGLNGVYEGLVEWWESHPDVAAEQLAAWTVALVLPGLNELAAGGSASAS